MTTPTPNDLPRHITLGVKETRVLHYKIERRLQGLARRSRDLEPDAILLLHEHLDAFATALRAERQEATDDEEGQP